MRPTTWLVFLSAVASLQARTPVLFQLDWIYNAQFAGLYQAIDQGYFAEEGLEVTLAEAPKSRGVVEAVLQHEGIAFGSSESNVLLARRAAGDRIVAVGTMFQDSPIGWMSLAARGFSTPSDFRGKRIGIHADGVKVLQVALARAGMSLADVELVDVGYDPDEVISGRVDLMQAYDLDEYVALQLRTRGAGSIILARDHGYIAYSQVIFTTETVVRDDPGSVRGLLRALRRGWEYALAHPEPTIDLILARYNPGLDRAHQIASLARIGDLVKPGGAPALAPLSRERWAASQAIFLEYGVISDPVDLDAFIADPLLEAVP